jgi:mono/diheme cytochrome c family protein
VRFSRPAARAAGLAAAITAGFAAGAVATTASPPASHFADADDAALVTRGHVVYRNFCSMCHGRHMEGQALWQADDADRWRRAPALAKSGHAWRRSDEDLFHITKFGRYASISATAPSAMPGFARDLTDDDILAVVAAIKSRWPTPLRVIQASLNPNRAGMPNARRDSAWRFGPFCKPGTGK